MAQSPQAIRNARVPASLLAEPPAELISDEDDVATLDIEIGGGRITAITPPTGNIAGGDIDLDGGQVWPCFADIHTHLDLGHIWRRAPNPDGSFETALASVVADRDAHWNAEDLRRRMEFGLRCSYAHGTRAIRTHLLYAAASGANNLGRFP